MYFPSKEVLDDLHKFNDLPDTEEKHDINQKYLNDEIGNFEFYELAMDYMRNLTNRVMI